MMKDIFIFSKRDVRLFVLCSFFAIYLYIYIIAISDDIKLKSSNLNLQPLKMMNDPVANFLVRQRPFPRLVFVISGAVLIHLSLGTYHTFGKALVS